MEVSFIPIDDVRVYPKNNKIHKSDDVEQLAKSLDEFGWTQPICVDEEGIILAGHRRWLAAKLREHETVPVTVKKGLTDDQKRSYRILDNKFSAEPNWDFEAINEELLQLEETEIELVEEMLSDFIQAENKGASGVQDDGYDAPKKEEYAGVIIVSAGDVITLGDHKVLCGDSTDKESIQEFIGDITQISIIVTDPPYGVEYDPNWRDEADLGVGERSRGKVANDDRVDWSPVFQIIDCDVMYVWHAAKYAVEVGQSLMDLGYELVSQIIWAKQHFALSRGDYHWQHEPCWYAVKRGKRHNWQGARDQSTLWEISNNNAFGGAGEKKYGHGTQKPLECMALPIANNTGVGEKIYDPFLGSGTTLIAAEQLGRVCLGVEIEPAYCQVIVDRYFDYCERVGLDPRVKLNKEEMTKEKWIDLTNAESD